MFSTPRSGSTWLLELLTSYKGISYCFEPFDIRATVCKNELKKVGIHSWLDLYSEDKKKNLYDYKVLKNGYLRGRNPMPLDLKRWRTGLLSKEYRFFSDRLVFKILHACEDRIDWFEDNFNGEIVYLIRHPIPVSLSRTVAPRLETFFCSDYSKHFSSIILKEARLISEKGDSLQRKVLSWCFQNAIPLKNVKNTWKLITYEQLKIEPEKVMSHLSNRLDLKGSKIIKNIINSPSKTTGINKPGFDYSRIDHSSNAVAKWRSEVKKEEERKLMDILMLFEIDIYSYGSDTPNANYLIK